MQDKVSPFKIFLRSMPFFGFSVGAIFLIHLIWPTGMGETTQPSKHEDIGSRLRLTEATRPTLEEMNELQRRSLYDTPEKRANLRLRLRAVGKEIPDYLKEPETPVTK